MTYPERLKGIVTCLDQTIKKNVIHNIKEYIRLNDSREGWVIVSDYCIKDKQKPNDCLSFVILPMDTLFYHQITNSIKDNIPKEIKHIDEINDDTIFFLKNAPYILSLNFIVKNIENAISSKPKDNIKNIIIQNLENIKNRIKNNKNLASRYNIMISEMRKKQFNFNLFSQCYLVAVIVAYMHILILKYSKKHKITWLSDRGNITNSNNHFVYDLCQLFYENLRNKFKITVGENTISCGQEENNKLFYDELIKLPDFFVGALSSYDIKNHKVDKDKHVLLIDKVLADNPKCINLKLDFSQGIQCSRLVVTHNKQ